MVDTRTRCPGPEVLAAYIDRGLSLAERSRVDHHLASCHQCIALVAGVVRTVADVSEFTPHAEPAVETPSRAVTRRTLVGVLAAAAAVIAVVFTPSLTRTWQDRDMGLVNLGGVSEQRSVLGRLTGGFPHAPLGVPSAGGQDGRVAGTDRILLTSAKIRESFGERDTPSRLHDLGLSQLLAGRYDDAAHALLAASREQPGNARFLNDVAAVQLERARLGLRPDDLPRALASADRARRLDPSLTEAWFNRALAATALSLRDQARMAWTEYLARDSSSAWSVEARERLAELAKPMAIAAWDDIAAKLAGPLTAELADQAVRAQTTEARNFVEHDLLPKWAAAVLGGRDGAGELDRLGVMAAAFSRVGGDSLYLDTVSAIARADARRLPALAQAHATYASAFALHAEDRFADALPGLTTARAGFVAANSPFADRAALELSTVLYVSGKADEALALLEGVSRTADTAGYAYNAARASWVNGLIAFGQSRLADTQTLYEQTLAGFQRMGDAEQVASAHSLLAALHFYLGDRATEWHHRLESFEGLSVSRSHRLRHAVLSTAAAALRADDPEAALLIQSSVLDNAIAWGRSAAIAETLTQRGAVYLALGRTDEAKRDLADARKRLQDVPDVQFRSRLEVALLASESDALRATDPAAAAGAASRAIELVGQRRDRLRLAQLHLKLAKANVVWGNLRAAHVALDRGIQSFEDERRSLADEGRISNLDESWQLYETAVQLAIHEKDYERAFALSERARLRTLAELRGARPVRTLAEAEASVAANDAVVALNQFDDELAIWVVRRTGTSVFTRQLTRHDSQRLVARQQEEIRHEAAQPSASEALYAELLRPVATQLAGASRIVFVTDTPFDAASFPALWDRSRNQFLIERVRVSLAPSVSAVAAAQALTPAATGDALFLGGPDADAGIEAVAIAYDNPAVLTGAAATRGGLLKAMRERTVIHLAARTSPNVQYPLLSRVLLADEPGRRYSGAVLGSEIASQAKPATKLVVFGGSGNDNSNRNTGSQELVRAFMSAGIPAVLGTLPGTDGPATRQLMVDFHRQMSQGVAAEEALSTLQRNVLRSNGHRLGAWSALVLYGSDR